MEIFEFKSNFDNILTIKECRKQTFINCICITKTIEQAAEEAGVCERTLYTFLEKENITNEQIKLMRMNFAFSGKKVKLRYGSNLLYSRNN